MILDANISWGRWPFQGFQFASSFEMKRSLQEGGISGGLVRSAEAAFSPDIGSCNRELLREFDGSDGFIPVPAARPGYPEWKELLAASSSVRAVAAYPSYHGYSVLSKGFMELAEDAASYDIALVVVVRQEDERGQNKLFRISPVPVEEINALGKALPSLKIICLNCYFGELKRLLADAPNIVADIAFVEKLDTVKAIFETQGTEQIVFGSHTPFFYTAANLMKLKDSGIPARNLEDISHENLRRALKWNPS